jgi:hypothetical protein
MERDMIHQMHIVGTHGEWIEISAPECGPIAFSIERNRVDRAKDTLHERCGVQHEIVENGRVIL